MADELRQLKDENEEEEKVQSELSEEEQKLRDEFDQEEGIEFSQTINKDDLLKYNYYLMNNASNYMRAGLMLLLSILVIVVPIIRKENLFLIIIGVVLLIYSLLLHFPLQKLIIKNSIKKKVINEYTINVKFASRIKYQLKDEVNSPLVDYKNIYKIRVNSEYMYLHLSAYAIIIVKLECVDDKQALLDFVKSKYLGTKVYKEISKK